jgi:hypothetical protein
MAIQIPSSLPINNTVDFHRNDLVSPPSAPTVVESLGAIDPRVAMKMPLPVVDSTAGNALHGALQDAVAKFGTTNLQQLEPHVEKAVLLKLSNAVGLNTLIDVQDQNVDVQNLLSQNLSRLDKLGSAALGQLLSNILEVDIPELGEQVSTQNKSKVNSEAIVNWPNTLQAKAGEQVDPKLAMAMLYQNLQNSGIFAADQLKKLLLPAGSDGSDRKISPENFEDEAARLVSQLSTDTSAVRDSVKLLLRGDLLWQGQLMPNVQGRLYREDAWETEDKPPFELQKGSRITLDVTLPNLGPFKVVGTQFGESVHVAIQASPEAQSILANSFSKLLEQMHTQVDPDAKVSLKDEASSS